MPSDYKHLTQQQIHQFLNDGYIVVKGAFTKEKAEEFTKTIWIRLGLDPDNKNTWDRERIHMPWHKRELVSTFAPKAWVAITELLGGEDRVDEISSSWGDSFILNLGTDALENAQPTNPRDLDNWHVDGDFFVHYLDSPEQALLVIPIFSDIKPRGGGTFISPDGLDMIAKYLSRHPEGVLPTGLSFTPSTSTCAEFKDHPGYWSHLAEIKKCNRFIEMTGEVGDVVLLHPLMLHSASKNHLRVPRVITNPPVAVRVPFNFNRENPEEYSLVERKTLKALGVNRFDFKITTERRRIMPKRMGAQNKALEEEKRRLAEFENARKLGHQFSVDSSVAVA